ncbi:MAG: hypothetical protein WBB98_03900 [Xanthobacteraceae bacterium]
MNEMTSTFRETGAPGAAWLAYRYAQDHRLPVPEIVATEIARFVAEITSPLLDAWNGDRKAKLSAKDITAAWGCSRGKDQAEVLVLSRRDVQIYIDFWDKVREGETRTATLDALADAFGLSRSAVENIVDRFRKADGGLDPVILYRDG